MSGKTAIRGGNKTMDAVVSSLVDFLVEAIKIGHSFKTGPKNKRKW